MKKVIFTLTSARSGTLYLKHLFQNNVPNGVSRHEPFFDWGNPTLFGPAIYDAYAGRLDRIRERLARKLKYVNRLPGAYYLESSHAFLKSLYVAALEFFPDMRLIHLIRDPLKVAKSEAYRQEWRRRVHAPFHFYEGEDGRRHFCWALTGNEEIFQAFAPDSLSPFQWCLVQWIEIENRAIRFLEQHRLHDRCFTLHTPADLNTPATLKQLFDFLGLSLQGPEVILGGRTNKSIGRSTIIDVDDESQAEAVLARLPVKNLEIFSREPYTRFGWSRRLQRPLLAKALTP